MKGMPFKPAAKGIGEGLWRNAAGFSSSAGPRKEGYEPRSVLDRGRSPSPPTSTSTLSSSFGGGYFDAVTVAAISENPPQRWPPSQGSGAAGGAELQPMPPGLDMANLEQERCGPAVVGDWDSLFSEPSAVQDQTFLRWVMADSAEPFALGLKPQTQPLLFSPPPLDLQDPLYDFEPGESSFHFPAPGPSFPGDGGRASPAHLGLEVTFSSAGLSHNPQPVPAHNPGFVLPMASFSHFMPDPSCQIAPAKAKPPPPPPPQAVVDQLFEAAELIESGDFVNAREILARLNQQLSPAGKPVLRSAFYCKEALESIISASNPSSSPLDALLKLGAHKAFSDLSPLLHFANFTSTQAVLDQMGGCDRIHVVDFDIGLGGQWSSLLQELARRRSSPGVVPSLKLTAFARLSSHHPFELGLVQETLIHFARDLNVQFEFNILAIDSFDPAALLAVSRGYAIAVNLPASSVNCSSPGLVRLVKQLSPKLVVCVDHGWDHSDFSFPRHVLHVLQSAAILLDSIDAAGGNAETASKIERYLLQPRIHSSIVGRHGAVEKAAAPPWKVFASAGLVPLKLSNLAEVQAECLVNRSQVRGFHLEKRQSSLVLCWQRGGLASVSAWS
ncbi:scarecrow-like protein 6 [Wolffia australiana]